MKPGSILAILILSLVSLAHLLRVIFRVEIVAGGVVIPMWVSVAGFLVTGAVALELWRERH